MIKHTPLLVSILLASGLSAQTRIAPTMVTAGDVGVYANTNVRSVTARTAIIRPLTLSTRDTTAGATSTAGLLLQSATQPGAGAKFTWSGRATAGMPAGKCGTTDSPRGGQGPQVYALTLTSRSTVNGKLVIAFSGRGNDPSASASAALDLNGRVIRMPSGTPVRLDIPRQQVTSSGLSMRISINGKADASNVRESIYGGQLSVLFVPDGGTGSRCAFVTDKPSCRAGGSLTAAAVQTPRGTALNFRLRSLANSAAFLLVAPTGAVSRINIGAQCLILNGFAVVANFRTDAQGTGGTALLVPNVVPGVGYFQSVTVNTTRQLVIAPGNTLKATCR